MAAYDETDKVNVVNASWGITNTGDRAGGEVAQLWLSGELRGFRKV